MKPKEEETIDVLGKFFRPHLKGCPMPKRIRLDENNNLIWTITPSQWDDWNRQIIEWTNFTTEIKKEL